MPTVVNRLILESSLNRLSGRPVMPPFAISDFQARSAADG